jgi:hypothetical protein
MQGWKGGEREKESKREREIGGGGEDVEGERAGAIAY